MGRAAIAAFTVAMAIVLTACAKHPRSTAGGVRVAITVTEEGFRPPVVTVPAGQPVTLVVTRTTDQTCATDFVMPDRGIKQALPLNHPVEIALAAGKPATLRYACAMDMYRGTIEVR